MPEHIFSARSTNAFKNRLDRYLKDQEMLYDDIKAKLVWSYVASVPNTETESRESGEEEP